MYNTERRQRGGISTMGRPRAPPGERAGGQATRRRQSKKAGPMWGIDPAITKHSQVARRS